MAKASRVAARQAKAVREIAERMERLEKKVDFIVSTAPIRTVHRHCPPSSTWTGTPRARPTRS